MTRILHVTKRYPPYIGGIETLCRDTCKALEGSFEQLVFAYNDKNEFVDEVYEGIRVIRVPVQKVIASQPLSKTYGKELRKAFREFKPDIVHFDYPNPFAAHYLLKVLKKEKFTGKFALFWVADIIKQKLVEPFFKPQTKKLLNMADVVMTLAPTYTKNTSYLPYYDKHYETLAPRIGNARLVVTEEQKKKAQEIREKYKDKTICFTFGRHVPYKGLDKLIDADDYLDQEKIQILIGGSGPETEKLEQQASKYKNIEFLGRLSDEDINSYLMACDIMTFSSITRNEAFGIALAEGLHFGKPACTFEIPGSGVNWVSIKDETGLEAPNGDVKAYAENITRLSNDPALYDKLAEQARLRADELFSEETFRREALRIYKELEERLTK